MNILTMHKPRVLCGTERRRFRGNRQLFLLIYMATAGGFPRTLHGMAAKNAVEVSLDCNVEVNGKFYHERSAKR